MRASYSEFVLFPRAVSLRHCPNALQHAVLAAIRMLVADTYGLLAISNDAERLAKLIYLGEVPTVHILSLVRTRPAKGAI